MPGTPYIQLLIIIWYTLGSFNFYFNNEKKYGKSLLCIEQNNKTLHFKSKIITKLLKNMYFVTENILKFKKFPNSSDRK